MPGHKTPSVLVNIFITTKVALYIGHTVTPLAVIKMVGLSIKASSINRIAKQAPIEIPIIDEPIVDENFTLLLKIIMHLLTICHQFCYHERYFCKKVNLCHNLRFTVPLYRLLY